MHPLHFQGEIDNLITTCTSSAAMKAVYVWKVSSGK